MCFTVSMPVNWNFHNTVPMPVNWNFLHKHTWWRKSWTWCHIPRRTWSASNPWFKPRVFPRSWGLFSTPATSKSESACVKSNTAAGKVLTCDMRRLRDVKRNLLGIDGTIRTANLPPSTASEGARRTFGLSLSLDRKPNMPLLTGKSSSGSMSARHCPFAVTAWRLGSGPGLGETPRRPALHANHMSASTHTVCHRTSCHFSLSRNHSSVQLHTDCPSDSMDVTCNTRSAGPPNSRVSWRSDCRSSNH